MYMHICIRKNTYMCVYVALVFLSLPFSFLSHWCSVSLLMHHSLPTPNPTLTESDTRAEPSAKQKKRMHKAQEAQYRELSERIERQSKLETAAHLLQNERLLQVCIYICTCVYIRAGLYVYVYIDIYMNGKVNLRLLHQLLQNEHRLQVFISMYTYF